MSSAVQSVDSVPSVPTARIKWDKYDKMVSSTKYGLIKDYLVKRISMTQHYTRTKFEKA